MAGHKVAVIGGGWAGCAAALELTEHGNQVTLFESARTLGGRARAVEINGIALDNGQHILLGAYTETLRLMRLAGIDEREVILRLPLQMRYPETGTGMTFIAPRLPAPLHLLAALLRAHGLSRADKLALARFSTTARWMGWQLYTDCSVSELLERFDQTDRLTRLMWRPLCIAALNTPPERASAQIFLNVLRDSLGAARTASDMLLPRVDLSTLFPQRVANRIAQAGGSIELAKTVKEIRRMDDGWRLVVSEHAASVTPRYDHVIIATQPTHAAELLRSAGSTVALPAFGYEPITTCYLQYGEEVRLPHPFYALLDDADHQAWAQFVFDRGHTHYRQAGLLAVVISASSSAIGEKRDALTSHLVQQLANDLQMPALLQPRWSKLITEKRATFTCAPGLQRPTCATGLDGLFLAGDYTASDYPATLEAATRSGVQAARLATGN